MKMWRAISPAICLLAAVFAALVPPASLAREGSSSGKAEFRVVVPRFAWEDSGELGYNVAFALNHEIFRTFNKSIPPGENGQAGQCCLYYGAISILHGALPEQSNEAAVELATLARAQLVLWGKAWPYGPDVVVQPFLTVASPPKGMERPAGGAAQATFRGGIILDTPFDDDGQWSLWQIDVSRDEGPPASVRLTGFPGSSYEMSPIVFDRNKLDRFSSFADMPVYPGKSESLVPIGKAGNQIQAWKHEEDGWSKLIDPPGWIRLPDLEAMDTVDFVGGLVHFMRGNWRRARPGFERVMNSGEAPTQVRIDAALLLAATLYRLNPDCSGCETPIAFALDLNPFSHVTAKYSFMASLAKARNSGDANAWRDVHDRFENIASLLPEDDGFLEDAREVMGLLEAREN